MSGTLEEVPPMNVPADGVPASSQMNHSSSKVSKAMVILGAQWGDEGKGKAVDQLAAHVDIVCRCQGGNNAGHTVVVNGTQFHFHLLPSGIINRDCTAILGNGVVIHLPALFDELETNEKKAHDNWKSRLFISDRAHIVFDFHQQADGMQEREKGSSSLGTTKKGIGPTYSSKATRNGIRIGDLVGDYKEFTKKFITLAQHFEQMFPELKVNVDAELERYKEYAEKIRPCVTETVSFLDKALKAGKKVLVEGANAAMLDIDFGTYPYVTSSNCSIGGVSTGLGLASSRIGDVIGVVKAYTTRVGDGPFPTELNDSIGEILQTRGHEYGVTTKRKRRCGWLDLALLKYTSIVNGYTSVFVTKLDILDTLPEIKVCVGYRLNDKVIDYYPSQAADLAKVQPIYETITGWNSSTEGIRSFQELPLNARKYIEMIEKHLNVPVQWIGVGADRESVITVLS